MPNDASSPVVYDDDDDNGYDEYNSAPPLLIPRVRREHDGGACPPPVIVEAYALIDGRARRRRRDARGDSTVGYNHDDDDDDDENEKNEVRTSRVISSSSPHPSHDPSTISLSPVKMTAIAGATSSGSHSSMPLTPSISDWYDHYSTIYPTSYYLDGTERTGLPLEAGKDSSSSSFAASAPVGGWFRRLLRWGGGGGIVGGGAGGQSPSSVERDDDEDDDDEGECDDNYDDRRDVVTRTYFDPSAIPREASSFHRFCLASERRCCSYPSHRHSDGRGGAVFAAIVVPARPLVTYSSRHHPSSSSDPYYCIVGYGRITEFRSSSLTLDDDDNDDDDVQEEDDAAMVSLTSDWRRLTMAGTGRGTTKTLKEITKTTTLRPLLPPRMNDLRHARATGIGRDCLAISWGNGDDDGSVVFYRRRRRRTRRRSDEEGGGGGAMKSDEHIGWDAIAVTHPSEAVVRAALDSMTTTTTTPHLHYFGGKNTRNDEGGEGGTGTGRGGDRATVRDAGNLIVTDIMSVSTNDGDDVVVVISRLGGFVELLPLPRWVWRPNLDIDDDNDDRASDSKNVVTAPDAPSRLSNLTNAIKITAFTTAQHHFDVMSLDAFICPPASHRPPVGGRGGGVGGRGRDPTMAAEASPTPVEFVVATCGGGRRRRPTAATTTGNATAEQRSRLQSEDGENVEVVTLWAVSISCSSTSQSPSDGGEDSLGGDVDEYDNRDRNEYSLSKLIVRRLGHQIFDNVGAESSVFLSDVAAERWTSSTITKEGNGRNDGERSTSPTERDRRRRKGLKEKQIFTPCSTTVATTAVPVAMLRFTPPMGNSRSVGGGVKDYKVLLAALDCNGGVSVLDVTEQSNCNNDTAYNHDGNSKEIFCSRDSTMTLSSGSRRSSKSSSKGGMVMAISSQIEWWSPGGGDGDVRLDADLAAVEGSHSCSFTLVTFATLSTGQNKNEIIFHTRAKSSKTKAIVRMQRWSWPSGVAEAQIERNPSDVFCMPMLSDGRDSAVVLLPMPVTQNRNKMLSFLRLSAENVPDVADENHTKTATSNSLLSFDPTSSPQCRLHLSICGIKKFSDPAKIIAALLRRRDASKAIGVARRFGISGEEGQRQNFDLGEEGRLMMNQCRIQLWEERWNVKALKNVSDDAYVIRQAMTLLQFRDCCKLRHDCDVIDDSFDVNEGLSLNNLLETFREAVTRCDAIEDERMTSIARQLREAVRRIGTFKLLLNHYGGISSNEQFLLARRFLCDFKHESLYDIATCAASKGDIYALTVLIVRHPFSFTMSERMQILDRIPLDVDIALYEQLLPCDIDGESHRTKKDARSFFLKKTFLNPLQLFTHLSNLQLQRLRLGADRVIPEIDIFTDDSDRDFAMLHFDEGLDDPSSSRSMSSTTKADVATWYLNRVLCTHNLTGQVLPFKELCAAGLLRLGVMSYTEDGAIKVSDSNNVSDSNTESYPVGKLIYLYSAASLFCQILADKLLCWTLRQQSSLLNETFDELKVDDGLFLSVIQFCTMDLKDTIPYIIENGNIHSISMFQKHFAHFVDGSSKYLEPRKNIEAAVSYFGSENNTSDGLEHDMMEFCLNKIMRLRKTKIIPALLPSVSIKLEESLTLCADFASLYIGCNSKSRISQKEEFLIEFLEKIFNSTLDVIKDEWGALTYGVIGKLWSIFELLPCTIAHQLGESPSNATIYKGTLSGIHFRLVALQLCCKWHACEKFPSKLWNALHSDPFKGKVEYDNQGTRDLCIAGRGVISIMCSAFCDRAAKAANNSENFLQHDEKYDDGADRITSGALTNKDHGLLFDFITDVDEFDSRFFASGAQQSGCIGSFVFSSLLYQHCFVMLKNTLKMRPSWFCQNSITSTIASFVRDAATSKNKNANAMVAYHEILGQVFPHLRVEFEHHQRVIAAKEFMAVVMELDDALLGKLFKMFDNSTKPIDLMRVLIDTHASVILLGCEFWSDKSSALAACTDASVFLSAQIRALMSGRPAEESSHVLPPMPGALVIQLSNIIGLYAPQDILLVKSFMASGALRMNLGPAAVAICYSMLCDAANSRRENNPDSLRTSHQDLQVLNCVVAIARAQSFLDLSIKRDLCTLTLQLISIADLPLSCELLGAFKKLEYDLLALEMNSLNGDAAQLTEAANDFLVFKAAGLVVKGARDLVDKTNKNADVLMKWNNFHDRSMIRVIKKSSHVDLLEKLFLMGDEAVDYDARGLAKSISEAIFSWVIAEVFLARKSSIHLSLLAANIIMMTELGLACLIEFQGQDMSLVIKRALRDFNAKSGLPIAQTSPLPEPTSQPDLSIIQRLRDRGYGRNAARRAVIMTDNQGYSAALAWAVSHFSDVDFDSPIYFLCSDTIHHVDQGVVDMVDKLLQSIQNRVKGNWSTNDTSKHDQTPEACTKPSKPLHKSYGSSILRKRIIASKIPCQSPFASPLTSGERDQRRDRTSSFNAQASAATEQSYATEQTEAPFVASIPNPTATKARLPHNAADKYSTRTSDTETPMINAARRPLPRNSPDSASSVEGSLSSRASVKDQIKLGRARFETQKLSLDERKKLALEGQRLLNAARAQRKSVFAPPTTITTSSSLPPSI